MATAPTKVTSSPHTRRIYNLTGYSPEVIAVAFAKTSRVPDSFDQIAAELSEESSSKFHEKWVIGYGHASVAEHAVLNVALENISILATKVIEDNRLASYTEQSTRYQVYANDRFYRPASVMASRHAERCVATCRALMGSYTDWMEPMMEHLAPTIERTEKMSERLWQTKVRAAACDTLRYLLPTSTQTNLGWTANARVFEHAITKLGSHPLEEMRDIAVELRTVCSERVPTLLKYADPSDYLIESRPVMKRLAEEIAGDAPCDDQWDVKLVHFDRDAEDRVIASLLYEHTATSYEETMKRVAAMSAEERQRVLDEAVARRGDWDHVGRAWETTSYTFDMLVDYGAFRDIQRHRMATQINQPVTTEHGFMTPPQIESAGRGDDYRALMDEARETFEAMAEDMPDEAQYVVPLSYRKRTLFTLNLRELHHLVQLRSGPAGHPSYRLLANRMLDAVRAMHPTLATQVRHTPFEG